MDNSEEQRQNCQDISRTREHLSNERTYLAWMRTAIALMGFAVVIVRLRSFQQPQASPFGNTWKLGLFFAIISLITILLTTLHYFAIRKAIEEDRSELADRWAILFSLAVILLGTGVFYFLFVIPALHI